MPYFDRLSGVKMDLNRNFSCWTRLALYVLLIVMASCDMRKRTENSEALIEEIESREIKRLTEAEIFAEANRIGDEISLASQRTLGSNLKMAIAEHGLEEAIRFCNLQAMPLTDSLASEFGAMIGRTSLKVRNPSNQPTDLEAEILEAYAYNVEHDLDLLPNLQRIDQNYLLYSRPIVLNNPLCLNCHGQPGEETINSHWEIIRSLYPKDKAVGYELGQLRGMWSIKLSQKEIIMGL